MLAFQNQGHNVILLNQSEGQQIHEFLQSRNIKTCSYVLSGKKNLIYFLRHIFFLIAFCQKNKIDILYSHLESANFVASIAQFFIRAKVYICRHHIDEGNLYNFDRGLNYRATYFLARKIIVVSEHAKRYMIEREGINGSRIIHINLAYDFSLYKIPENSSVNKIRTMYNSDILLLSACRLTKFKRPDVAVRTLKILRKDGMNAKLLLLGRGEMEESIRKLIFDLDLQQYVFLLGHVENVLDHMLAADFFLHPSMLESSSVVVKEAGYLRRPVIVTSGVGDFNEYIVHETNGFLVRGDNYEAEASKWIKEYHLKREKLTTIGDSLYATIIRLFSVEKIIMKYKELNEDSIS